MDGTWMRWAEIKQVRITLAPHVLKLQAQVPVIGSELSDPALTRFDSRLTSKFGGMNAHAMADLSSLAIVALRLEFRMPGCFIMNDAWATHATTIHFASTEYSVKMGSKCTIASREPSRNRPFGYQAGNGYPPMSFPSFLDHTTVTVQVPCHKTLM